MGRVKQRYCIIIYLNNLIIKVKRFWVVCNGAKNAQCLKVLWPLEMLHKQMKINCQNKFLWQTRSLFSKLKDHLSSFPEYLYSSTQKRPVNWLGISLLIRKSVWVGPIYIFQLIRKRYIDNSKTEHNTPKSKNNKPRFVHSFRIQITCHRMLNVMPQLCAGSVHCNV